MKVTRIFTDGACSGNPGPGGWAAVYSNGNKCKVLSGNSKETTNNRMELLAVVRVLEKIESSRKKGVQYQIYSDSAYVVNAINMDWLFSWKKQQWQTKKGEPVKNTDLWKRCYSLLASIRTKQKEVQFIKVKGHAGNPLNEYADKVAREQSQKAARK